MRWMKYVIGILALAVFTHLYPGFLQAAFGSLVQELSGIFWSLAVIFLVFTGFKVMLRSLLGGGHKK